MYRKTSLSAVEPIEGEPEEDVVVDGVSRPLVRPVGYELRPENVRLNSWVFEAGDEIVRHRQREQEELYYQIAGEAEMEIDGEVTSLTAGDLVVVSPDAWRRVVATTDGEMLIVGAPGVKDDGIVDPVDRS